MEVREAFFSPLTIPAKGDGAMNDRNGYDQMTTTFRKYPLSHNVAGDGVFGTCA